jgi:hypothetical protein
MGWLSMLVKQELLDEIEVHFLIVGHTHTTIDQYFGVISKLIRRTSFIGTPLALEHLLRNGIKRKPMVKRRFYINFYC